MRLHLLSCFYFRPLYLPTRPQISVCLAESLSNKELYPTFLRTVAPFSVHSAAFVKVFEYFSWHQCCILTSTEGLFFSAAIKIREEFSKEGIKVVVFIEFNPGTRLELVAETVMDSMVRVILILCYEGDFGNFVWNIHHLRGLQLGWAWFTIYNLNMENALAELKRLESRVGTPASTALLGMNTFQGTLAMELDMAPQTAEYRKFKDDVRARMPEFGVNMGIDQVVDIYAGPFYDAVLLYAESVRAVLRKGLLPRDTPALIAAAKEVSFDGVTGFVKLDASGDRMANSQESPLTLLKQNFLAACSVFVSAILPVNVHTVGAVLLAACFVEFNFILLVCHRKTNFHVSGQVSVFSSVHVWSPIGVFSRVTKTYRAIKEIAETAVSIWPGGLTSIPLAPKGYLPVVCSIIVGHVRRANQSTCV